MVGTLAEIYLFVDDEKESKDIINILREKGLKYKVIDVTKNGIRGWLILEFGTSKTPILAFNRRIAVGYKNIMNLLKNTKPHSP